MIIIDDIVYLHIVKTGGTSIKGVLLANRPEDVQFEWQHAPAKMIPPEFKDFEKIALVRDPFTWYRSYYNYILWKKNGQLLAERMAMKNGRNKSQGYVSFEVFLDRALNLQSFIVEFDVINDIKRNMKKCGRLFFYSLWGDLTSSPKFETLYQFHIYGAIDKETTVLKMEESLSDVFKKLKVQESRLNVSPGSHLIEPQHKQKILTADKVIFDDFGYSKEIK